MRVLIPGSGADAIERRAFARYLRSGRLWPVTTVDASGVEIEVKFNPYHDPTNGRFTFAPGGPRSLARVFVSDRGRSRSGPFEADALQADVQTPSPDAPVPQDAVYRPESRDGQVLEVSRPPNSRARRGGNSNAFNDPLTLEQVFPGLRDAPGGAVLALADNILDLTGPARQAVEAVARTWSDQLLAQITALDPGYRFQSLGTPQTQQGWINQLNGLRADRAALMYKMRGEVRPLQVETLRFIQSRVDAAFAEALRRRDRGGLKVKLSTAEAIGNFVDRQVREDLRIFFNAHRIPIEKGQAVRVVGREYLPAGGERRFRIPDVRVGNVAYDMTVGTKSLRDPQVRDFFRSEFNPSAVIIIRPRQLGQDSTYAITRSGG